MEKKKKLLDVVRDKIRFKHYSIKTEQSYIGWIKHYIVFHNKRHPKEMGKLEIEQFLTWLADNQHYKLLYIAHSHQDGGNEGNEGILKYYLDMIKV